MLINCTGCYISVLLGWNGIAVPTSYWALGVERKGFFWDWKIFLSCWRIAELELNPEVIDLGSRVSFYNVLLCYYAYFPMPVCIQQA